MIDPHFIFLNNCMLKEFLPCLKNLSFVHSFIVSEGVAIQQGFGGMSVEL